MTREEAIRRIKAWNLDSDDRDVLAVVIPEFHESEDERIRKEIYNFFKNFKETGTWKSISDVNTWLAYLEKQKDLTTENIYKHSRERMSFWNGKQKEQKPAKWSEEDEDMINMLVSYVEYPSCWNLKYPREKLVAFIKSLRPHWKPSKEQMEALDKAIPVCMGVVGRDEIAPLESLCEELKKL